MNSIPKQIPSELEDIFEKLRWEIAILHLRWTLYRQLFGTNKKRIELLNKTAPLFFNQLHFVLLEDTILGLARLTESRVSSGHENLVLKQLWEGIDSSKYPNLSDNLNNRLKTVGKKCGPFRTYRHKIFAHRDLKIALSRKKNSLPGISKKMVKDALDEIRMFMNEFQRFFYDSETGYEHCVSPGDADTLVFALKKAFEYDVLKRDGKIPFDHLRKSKYWTC